MSFSSLIYGVANETDATDNFLNHPRIRAYRADGRGFFGHDTLDISHACSDACVSAIIASEGDWTRCENSRFSYVDLSSDQFPTLDVVDFDPGDDPYILCDNCQTELVRDEDAYLAQYGRPLTARKEETS